ncbi:MAG: sulfatase-like hydrolase/transferase [Planctomycetales bacterium]|nr:sulfatase-like hydrolase/transferase [Planctomycetales bacterium]
MNQKTVIHMWALSWIFGLSLPMAIVSAAQLPHIFILFVDDMGYGDPRSFNPDSKLELTNIDRLAAGGMRFTDAHAPGPLCHMSRYGLMTGRYPFRTDVSRWPSEPLIKNGQATLASMLKSQGYHTSMVGKWHCGFQEQGYDQPLPGGPVDVGFDTFFGIRASTDIPPYFYIRQNHAVAPPTLDITAHASEGWSPIQGAFWRAGKIATDLQLENVLPRFIEEAESVISNHAGQAELQPLFLYLALPAPHTPWLPSEEYRGKSKVGLYGDFAEMVDKMLGRVIAAMERAKMLDDALIIFTSDNGPVWYEEDAKRFAHDSCGPWRGMKADAWEAGHRMPFIVRWPGHVAPASECSQTICFTDLFATLAKITGYETKPEDGPDSFDFSLALAGNPGPVRPSLAMASGSGLMTVRQGPWKLIAGLGSGGFSEPRREQAQAGGPAGQLYNLADDPAESNNLYVSQPEIVKQLQAELDRLVAQ